MPTITHAIDALKLKRNLKKTYSITALKRLNTEWVGSYSSYEYDQTDFTGESGGVIRHYRFGDQYDLEIGSDLILILGTAGINNPTFTVTGQNGCSWSSIRRLDFFEGGYHYAFEEYRCTTTQVLIAGVGTSGTAVANATCSSSANILLTSMMALRPYANADILFDTNRDHVPAEYLLSDLEDVMPYYEATPNWNPQFGNPALLTVCYYGTGGILSPATAFATYDDVWAYSDYLSGPPRMGIGMLGFHRVIPDAFASIAPPEDYPTPGPGYLWGYSEYELTDPDAKIADGLYIPAVYEGQNWFS